MKPIRIRSDKFYEKTKNKIIEFAKFNDGSGDLIATIEGDGNTYLVFDEFKNGKRRAA